MEKPFYNRKKREIFVNDIYFAKKVQIHLDKNEKFLDVLTKIHIDYNQDH